MNEFERQFLAVAIELVKRQRELVALVGQALGVDPFAYWVRGDRIDDPSLAAVDRTLDGEWAFNFHGLEFDARHVRDGRHVRVDFGPRGRRAFIPDAVGGFVLASSPPWRVFAGLKNHLRTPLGHADHQRCAGLANSLVAEGFFAPAEPRLVALMAKYSRASPSGGVVLEIPRDELPEDETDLVLCDKLVLTEAAESWVERDALA